MFIKDILGTVSILLALVGNGTYFFSVLRNRTKPHVFSWFSWGLMTAIIFIAQSSADAGPGSWHFAANSFCCFAVAILAIAKGNHDITKSDIGTFICSLSAIPVWCITHEALTAVIIIIIVEAFAYYPTFRKAYKRPQEEMATVFTMDSIRAALSMLALQTYSVTTMIYPLFAVLVNTALVSIILLQRQRRFKGTYPSPIFDN